MTSPTQKQLWLQAALLGLAAVFILYPLSAFWSAVPDYSYGWGVPFLAIFLFLEQWPTRPARVPLTRIGPVWQFLLIFLLWALLLLISSMVLEANISWRPIHWVQISLLISGLLTWLVLYGGWGWARHFAFPVGFLFLCVPWLYSLEFNITQSLMVFNAQLAADTLILADIPAQAMGHTIQLTTCQLGVDEACSGIRSLQGSLMMALFLGEFYRFRLSQRGLLLLLAVLLAMVGNYLRMVFLALQGAFSGLAAVHAWHDTAGYFIMIFTVTCLSFIALLLQGRGKAPVPPARAQPPKEPTSVQPRQIPSSLHVALALFLAAFSAEMFTQGWFAWRHATTPHLPGWTVELPQNAPNFQNLPIPDTVSELLLYDRAIMARWQDAQGLSWSVNWFRYAPNAKSPVSLTWEWHNPNVCLPSAGMVKQADYGTLDHTVSGLHLQPQIYLFRAQGTDIYIFWLVYLNQPDLISEAKQPDQQDNPIASFFLTRLSWFRDAWYGRRGLDAETLEIGLTGTRDLESAKAAYLKLLDTIVKPEAKP